MTVAPMGKRDHMARTQKNLPPSHKYGMCAIGFRGLMDASDPVFAAMDFAPAPSVPGRFLYGFGFRQFLYNKDDFLMSIRSAARFIAVP